VLIGRRRSNIALLWRVVLGVVLMTIGAVLYLRWFPPPTTAFMLRSTLIAAREGRTGYRLHYRWLEWERISPHAGLAVIAAEDQGFLEHFGFDFNAITHAWKENKTNGPRRGGSTISQQVAKNLFLWPGKSYLRKGLEAYFTLLIEILWPKRRVLEIYLNIVEFGEGIFGIAAASQSFFGKPPLALTSAEAALLAAVLPNPRQLRVDQPSRYLKARRQWILKQMRQLGGTLAKLR
jgi:monofunctional glycosyltransferase